MNETNGARNQDPPSGWYRFGTHSGWRRLPRGLVFSDETDEAGCPLWERIDLPESVEVVRGFVTYDDGSQSPVERWVRTSDERWVSLDSERTTRRDLTWVMAQDGTP